jgi:hypothetical protein
MAAANFSRVNSGSVNAGSSSSPVPVDTAGAMSLAAWFEGDPTVAAAKNNAPDTHPLNQDDARVIKPMARQILLHDAVRARSWPV